MDNNLLDEKNSPTINDYKDIYSRFVAQMEDLKAVKKACFKIIEFMGMQNADGSIKEKPDVKKIMALAMKVATNPDKLKEELSFLSDFLPLLEKYKDL